MTIRTQYLALLRLGADEWWRTRSAVLFVAVIVLVFGFASFLAGLAATEVAAQRVTLYAGLVRPVVTLLFALVIVVALVRDFDDRVFDLLLARPLSRRTWYRARLGGQLLAALLLACVMAVPLSVLAPPLAAAAWVLSVACELGIVAAFALACAVSLGRVAPAMGAVAGFYLLSRSIAALVLMTGEAAPGTTDPGDGLVTLGVRGLALVLPDFSRYAQTAWLLGETPVSVADLTYALVQGLLYVALLALLGRVDFERRDL